MITQHLNLCQMLKVGFVIKIMPENIYKETIQRVGSPGSLNCRRLQYTFGGLGVLNLIVCNNQNIPQDSEAG